MIKAATISLMGSVESPLCASSILPCGRATAASTSH